MALSLTLASPGQGRKKQPDLRLKETDREGCVAYGRRSAPYLRVTAGRQPCVARGLPVEPPRRPCLFEPQYRQLRVRAPPPHPPGPRPTIPPRRETIGSG